jgi:hypothetical protein
MADLLCSTLGTVDPKRLPLAAADTRRIQQSTVVSTLRQTPERRDSHMRYRTRDTPSTSVRDSPGEDYRHGVIKAAAA